MLEPKISDDLSAELEALDELDDDSLWLAARRTVPDAECLETLQRFRNFGRLSAADESEYGELLCEQTRTMLLRARGVFAAAARTLRHA